MASTNRYTSFTITQPFLGAPLQFQPALGSTELEDLIDLYVTGSASKQSKLSEITIDFYNNATVDLNTGALTRTYNVLPQWSASAFEQSPASQSSGLSPVFTTSPGSCANFGDSGYGSASMTPPTHNRGRVTKKPRKETKKDAEIRLPGFSIMTKDGIDVTTSAGRGTKTKEQREHAHLMRIMKACPDCKRKKIRCDPAHKRSAEMSRTSTSSTKSSSSSAPPKPSPPSSSNLSSIPSSTPQTSYASGSTPSFSPSNPIDDFVLFPEDTWNIDMSFAGLDTQDLSQFSFDINALDQFPVNDSFDFSDPQLSNINWDNDNYYFGHTPQLVDQYGLDQWASSIGGNDMPVQHTRPHPSGPSTDSGQLSNVPVSGEQSPATSPIDTSTSLAQGLFNDGSLRSRPVIQNATDNDSPLSSSSDWSILEASLNVPSPQGQSGLLQSSDGNQRQSRKRPASDEDSTSYFTQSSLPLTNQPGSGSGIKVDPSDQPGGVDQSSLSSRSRQLLSQRRGMLTLPSSEVRQRSSESPTPIETSTIAVFADACQSTGDALTNLSSVPQAANLGTELQRLQSVLAQVQSDGIADLPHPVLAQVQTLASRLQLVSARAKEVLSQSPSHQRHNKLDPELRPDYLHECQIQARRIVRSLCATINAVQAQNTGTSSPTDGPMLTSGRNVHLSASESGIVTHKSPASLESGVQMWVESTMQWQSSSSSSSGSGSTLNSAPAVLLDSPSTGASTVFNDDAGRTRYKSPFEATSGIESSGDSRHSLVANEAPPDSPRASAPTDNQQSLVQSQSYDSANVPLLAVQRESGFQVHRYRNYAQADSTATSSNDTIDNVKSIDPVRRGSHAEISRLQVRRSESSSSNVPSNVGLSQDQYPQAASLPLESSSSVASVVDGQTSSPTAYQLVLPLLATLFASYTASSCGYTSLSPYLQLLIPFALSYFLPQSTSSATSSLNFATMVVVTLASTPLFNNLDSIRQAASAWIGSDPLIAVVKLTLCAVLTTQLPTFIGRSTDSFAHMGLTIMAFLSRFDSQSCQSAGLLNRHSISEESCSSSREGSSIPSWLAAMRELSLVGVV